MRYSYGRGRRRRSRSKRRWKCKRSSANTPIRYLYLSYRPVLVDKKELGLLEYLAPKKRQGHTRENQKSNMYSGSRRSGNNGKGLRSEAVPTRHRSAGHFLGLKTHKETFTSNTVGE